MNCKEAGKLITDMLFGELEESKKTEMQQHLDECPDCGKLLEQERQMTENIRQALSLKLPEMKLSENRRNTILDESRKHRPFVLFTSRFLQQAAMFLILGVFIAIMLSFMLKEIKDTASSNKGLRQKLEQVKEKPVAVSSKKHRFKADALPIAAADKSKRSGSRKKAEKIVARAVSENLRQNDLKSRKEEAPASTLDREFHVGQKTITPHDENKFVAAKAKRGDISNAATEERTFELPHKFKGMNLDGLKYILDKVVGRPPKEIKFDEDKKDYIIIKDNQQYLAKVAKYFADLK